MVEMKTVTQYTALIRLIAQMQGPDRIPDGRERKRGRKSSESLSDIDHTYGVCVTTARESRCRMFPQEPLVLLGVTTPPSERVNNFVTL